MSDPPDSLRSLHRPDVVLTDEWCREQIAVLRAITCYDEYPNIFEPLMRGLVAPSAAVVDLAVESHAARARVLGFWHAFALWDRAFTVTAFQKRAQENAGALRAYAEWLAKMQEDASPHVSKMLTELAAIVIWNGPRDEGRRLAHRALDCARNPEEDAAARIEIGRSLYFDDRLAAAETVFAEAVRVAPDGEMRRKAEEQRVGCVQMAEKREADTLRLWNKFLAMKRAGGLLEDIELDSFILTLRRRVDRRALELQRARVTALCRYYGERAHSTQIETRHLAEMENEVAEWLRLN
jgi:hypothetical protein